MPGSRTASAEAEGLVDDLSIGVRGTVVQVSTSRGGIPKLPVLEGYATPEGLVGDSWRNPQFHGGPKQAVLIICAEAIADLCSQGFALYPGALGENLTVAGLDRLRFRIGQHWQVGEAVVVLTKIRVPCKTLNIYGAGTIQKAVYDSQVKAGDPASPLWAKGGIYGAVIRAGAVRPGDAIELLAEP